MKKMISIKNNRNIIVFAWIIIITQSLASFAWWQFGYLYTISNPTSSVNPNLAAVSLLVDVIGAIFVVKKKAQIGIIIFLVSATTWFLLYLYNSGLELDSVFMFIYCYFKLIIIFILNLFNKNKSNSSNSNGRQ